MYRVKGKYCKNANTFSCITANVMLALFIENTAKVPAMYLWRNEMSIGEKIKEIRKRRGFTLDEVAERIGVSVSTLSRYEGSQITKIPVSIIEKLCSALGTTTQELRGTAGDMNRTEELPSSFDNAEEAMAFMLKMPVLAAYGGYDVKNMSDETIIEFANEILGQLKLVSYKYR